MSQLVRSHPRATSWRQSLRFNTRLSVLFGALACYLTSCQIAHSRNTGDFTT
ncbi:hypothetical protein BDR06DRAFT_951428 [Suillus hirtellus]|nr:hypothetical protein BDR06DRAFT_951428 [Suillus hirtellus]